ncbi:MAG: hypothetical protein JKY54_06070 [Flavobacteriales bacterium]|nr:hypothetical protein [Flavobacteriales bacterium]
MVDALNNLSTDPIAAENMRENFISYTRVLQEGRFKLDDYVAAVIYTSYKIMGYTNREAYSRTFPQRYSGLVAKGTNEKDILAYVSAYNRGKLVNLILEQSLVPVWVLNQDIHQRAINVLADLMQTAQSEKVRADSATSLLANIRKPENLQVELNIGVKENSGMTELKETLRKLALTQQQLIEDGVSTKTIAHQTIIEAEVVEIEDA